MDHQQQGGSNYSQGGRGGRGNRRNNGLDAQDHRRAGGPSHGRGNGNSPYERGGSSYHKGNNRTDQNFRSRPVDKNEEDHNRVESPDRQDRARPKDKQYEDHKRDPSPDRSFLEHQIPQSQNMDVQQGSADQQRQYQHDQRQGSFNKDNRNRRPQYPTRDGQNYNSRSGSRNESNWSQPRDGQNYDSRSGRRNEGKWNQPRDGQHYDNRWGESSWGEKSDVKLSKALSFILRHGAERQGFKLKPGGFLYIEEILENQKNLRDYTLEDIQRVTDTNDKKRFFMEKEEATGKWKIRANQGHTFEVKDLDLKPVLSKDEVPMVIHGTYMGLWEKIRKTGLSRMGRNHIHFAAGEPGENDVISGMRKTCDIMIHIDLGKALADGFQFFRSANNVILCAGNEHGVIPHEYFQQVVQRYPKKVLFVNNETASTPTLPVGMQADESAHKRKKQKKKKMVGDQNGEAENEKTNDSANTGVLEDEQMEVDTRPGESTTPTQPQASYDNTADVVFESSTDIITIDDIELSISSIDFLKTQPVVAVHCETVEDSISRIICVVDGKSYTFDLQQCPSLMIDGKLADFFNSHEGPHKVFNNLDSKTCALFFYKYDIVLDGTKLFDLKVACDMMEERGLGNNEELNETGFKQNCTLTMTDIDSINEACQTYRKAYSYLSRLVPKDYKKELYEMVLHDIDKNDSKKRKEERKKEAKVSNQAQNPSQNQTPKKKKGKGK